MKIRLDYIKFKNFCSYGNNWTTYNFSYGLYNLYGAIGQGKSTILSALYFNLYGQTFNGVNLEELINNTNDSKLDTESKIVIGEDEYIIKRGMKPSYLDIIKNGVKINDLSTKKLVQEQLNKILGMDSAMFKSVVGLSTKNNPSFFTMSKPNKRLMLENLFGLTLFASMTTEVKNEISTLKVDIDVLKRTMVIYEQSLIESKTQIKNMEKLKEDDSILRQKEIDDLNGEVLKLTNEAKDIIKQQSITKSSIVEIDESILDTNKKITEYLTYEKEKKSIESSILVIKHKITSLNNTDVCPTCYTKVDIEHKDKHVTEFNKELSILNSKLSLVESNVVLLEGYRTELVGLNKSKTELVMTSTMESTNLKSLSQRIKDLKLKIEGKAKVDLGIDIDSYRKEFDSKIVAYTKVKTDIATKSEDIKVDAMLVEILSDTGVKSFFMDKLLPVLNFKINEYLEKFEFPIRITINSTLGEKIETLSGSAKDRSYNSFSGGERKMMDVSVWLAFIDSVKLFLNWNSNLLFIDELFDEGTDLETLEKILFALRSMSSDNNMHISIISHKNPDVRFDGKYLATKSNGFSSLEVM